MSRARPWHAPSLLEQRLEEWAVMLDNPRTHAPSYGDGWEAAFAHVATLIRKDLARNSDPEPEPSPWPPNYTQAEAGAMLDALWAYHHATGRTLP